MRKSVLLTALLVAGCAPAHKPLDVVAEAPRPEVPALPEEVHAIMFYVTIDRADGHYTHAQVVGGYKDHDACTRAVAVVGAATAADLAPTDIPVFLCPEINVDGIKKEQEDAAKRPDDKPPLDDRLRTPSDTL
jgi:hypothetical protein